MTPTAEKAPPAFGDRDPRNGRLFNGEKWMAPKDFARDHPPTPQVVGGRSTATAPTRSDIMALGMNQKLPQGQEMRINAADLGDTRTHTDSVQQTTDGVTITSNEPPKYVQYDDWGIARRIFRSTYLEVKKGIDKDGHRLHDACPLCGGDHPETEWDPNACSAREPLSGYICPQQGCGKECWPDYQTVATAHTEVVYKHPAMKALPVPQRALEAMAMNNLRQHVGTYHPSLAAALGYPVNRGDGVYVSAGTLTAPVTTPIAPAA